MSGRRALLLLVLGLLAASPATADRLHLEGGGVIDTDSWWLEGDTLIYESGSGTIGIPRSMVLRIEKLGRAAAAAGPREPRAAHDGSGSGTGPPQSLERQKRRDAARLFREGKQDLDSRDFESASMRFLEAIGLDERLTAARVGYAVSEISLGRDGLALAVVLDGLALAPRDADLNELLGDLRNREERVADAVRAWRVAFDSEPNDRLRDKIVKGERELQAGRDYAFSTTSHFNVRFDSDGDRELAAAVVEFLERQYWTAADRFRHAPPQPITVLLYPKREFRDVTQAADNVGGVYDGKIRVPLGGLNRLDPRAEAVLRHELTHAVVHSKTRGNCPRWLHEGLAQAEEGRRLDDAARAAVAELLAAGDPAEWESRRFLYPAALSLVRYLEALRGPYGLLDVLDALAEGQDADAALERVYGEPYAVLCRRWAREVLGDSR